MSSTYIVNGYVDIRIKLVDRDVHASQSSSPADIAELVKMEFEAKIGNCDILGHKMMLKEIG
jgi:hypothetical protein